MLDSIGVRLYGIACLLLGVASLALRDQLISNWQLPGVGGFIVVTGIAQIIGGAAILFRKTERPGAVTLGVVYLIFTLTFVPEIFAHPGVYESWGDVFYQLSLVAAATIAYYSASPSAGTNATGKAALVVFGLCNISFAADQVEFLSRTTGLVPKWMPPSGMFWAVATTIAFAAAGVSIASGYAALLASRLVGLMLAIFGVAIWVPLLIADPKTHSNWSEGIETFAIAGAAWIVSDFLSRKTAVPR